MKKNLPARAWRRFTIVGTDGLPIEPVTWQTEDDAYVFVRDYNSKCIREGIAPPKMQGLRVVLCTVTIQVEAD